MITIGCKGERKMLKYSLFLVIHQACFPMHRLWCAYDFAAVNLTNGLVPQADAKRGNAVAKGLDDQAGKPCFVRCTWSRRYDDVRRLHCLNVVKRHLVVPVYL